LELPVTGLTAIRSALPPDAQIPPLPELSAAVARAVRLRLASNYARLCAILPGLLNDLHRAYVAWQGQRRTAVAALLVQAYRAADTDDPDTAVCAARNWDPPEELPAERRSHFYIDLARAQARLDRVDETVLALFQARAVAPEHTRFHPQVRGLVSHLVDGGAASPQVREYAQWAAVPLASADGRPGQLW
jgi:hypothetical protein